MNEIQETNISKIETEIIMLKQQTAQNIIEIGKRLIQAKEMLPHGEWGNWLDEKVSFKKSTATKFMQAATEFTNFQALGDLSQTKIFTLLELPSTDREEFIETQPIEDMTTRELQQAIKEKRELEKQLDEIKARPPKVEIKEVEKIPDDYHELKKTAARLQRQLLDKDHELETAKSQKQILERKAQLNDSEAKKYKELKDQIEKLSKQKNELGRQIKARTELSALVIRVEHILKTELAPIKYSRAIDEARDDEVVINNLTDIVTRVKAWCTEMENIIEPVEEIHYIESEVIR